MRIDLTHVVGRAIFLAFVLFVSGMLTFLSGKAFLASHWNASSNPEIWLKAARLEPSNAEYWGHLGTLQQWNLEPGRIQEAIRYLQKATEINPRSADLWMELADAYVSSGDPAHALEAFEKAQANYPMSAEVAWRYGSFLLFQGRLSNGYAEIQRAISIDPSLTKSAITECWRSNPSASAILDMVLPPKPEYYESAIDFFLSQTLPDPALAVWNRQQELGLPTVLSEAIPLVNVLIERDRVADAEQTWQQALHAANWSQDRDNSGSLVFNGRFEHDTTNGGFDWREGAVSGARFGMDSEITHATSSRSFRIQFDGTANLDFQNLFQYVSVQPKCRYHFSAFVRTEKISTDSGVRFEILDTRHPSQVQIVTPNFIGTNPWTLVQTDVVTGPETNLLKITLRRMPSWKFDNKLSGTVWVDDVTLTRAQPTKDNSG
jgi:hypothetical protein